MKHTKTLHIPLTEKEHRLIKEAAAGFSGTGISMAAFGRLAIMLGIQFGLFNKKKKGG